MLFSTRSFYSSHSFRLMADYTWELWDDDSLLAEGGFDDDLAECYIEYLTKLKKPASAADLLGYLIRHARFINIYRPLAGTCLYFAALDFVCTKKSVLHEYVLHTDWGGFWHQKIFEELRKIIDDFPLFFDDLSFRSVERVVNYFREHKYSDYKIVKCPYGPEELILLEYDGMESLVHKNYYFV